MVAGIGERGGGALLDVDALGASAVDSRPGGVELRLQSVAVLAVEAAPQSGDDGWGVAGDHEGLALGDAADVAGPQHPHVLPGARGADAAGPVGDGLPADP